MTKKTKSPARKNQQSRKTIFGIDVYQFVLRCVLIAIPILIILSVIAMILFL